MRKFIRMSEQEKSVYDLARQIREYGEKTGQPTFAFLDWFYTLTKSVENGETVDVIRFKKHSFKNLLNVDAPDDVVSRKKDKLLLAFQIGLHNGEPVWNVPA